MTDEPRTAAGRYDRELFLRIAADLQRVSRETGYSHPEYLSGHEWPATDIPCLPETIAEQVVEKHLIEAEAASPDSEALLQLARDVVEYGNDPKLIEQARAALTPEAEDE
jgi:hypothetical protein